MRSHERIYTASLAWYLAQQSYGLGVVGFEAHADVHLYYSDSQDYIPEKRELKAL